MLAISPYVAAFRMGMLKERAAAAATPNWRNADHKGGFTVGALNAARGAIIAPRLRTAQRKGYSKNIAPRI